MLSCSCSCQAQGGRRWSELIAWQIMKDSSMNRDSTCEMVDCSLCQLGTKSWVNRRSGYLMSYATILTSMPMAPLNQEKFRESKENRRKSGEK